MSTHEKHILRILGEAREPLLPSEIADRLNWELGGETAYTAGEVAMHLKSLDQQVKQLPDGRWERERENFRK